MHSLGQAIWGDLWKSTMGKSRTTATCVTLHPLGHAIWGHIWKTYWRKVKKNVTSVILHPSKQTFWPDIWIDTVWKYTIEKSQTSNASSQANDLRKHLKMHSGEKSSKCNQCDYASSQAGNLKLHLKTHSGEKSNKCNQCDYASSQASDLICLHIWKHTGEKSIKCNQCDYAFRQTIWKSTVEVFCNQPRVFTPVRVANVPTPQCKCTTIISDQQF